jgi:hypothetical protein
MDKNIWTILALFCLVAAALTQGAYWTGPAPAPFYRRIPVHPGWLGLAVLLAWAIFK